MSNDAIAVADALGRAIQARSQAEFNALYADDIVVWHGNTGKGMSKSENIALLGGLFALASHLQYVGIRRHLIDGGVVQQHQLTGTFTDGTPVPTLEACLVIKVRNRQIVRIDEYFDGQSFTEVWKRLAALEGQ